jgi:hypothetical protein
MLAHGVPRQMLRRNLSARPMSQLGQKRLFQSGSDITTKKHLRSHGLFRSTPYLRQAIATLLDATTIIPR